MTGRRAGNFECVMFTQTDNATCFPIRSDMRRRRDAPLLPQPFYLAGVFLQSSCRRGAYRVARKRRSQLWRSLTFLSELGYGRLLVSGRNDCFRRVFKFSTQFIHYSLFYNYFVSRSQNTLFRRPVYSNSCKIAPPSARTTAFRRRFH